MTDNIEPPPYAARLTSDAAFTTTKTESFPGYNAAVSSSANATPQKTTSQTAQVQQKTGTGSQQPALSESPLQWAEPHQGDDKHTAMLREFTKSKLYTFDNAKSARGGMNW